MISLRSPHVVASAGGNGSAAEPQVVREPPASGGWFSLFNFRAKF
jgi:hypothetical protein